MSVQTPNQSQPKTKISMDRIVDALLEQLIYININEIVLVYVENWLVRVVLRNGTVISMDAETLQIYNIETPSDALHRLAVLAFDRDE